MLSSVQVLKLDHFRLPESDLDGGKMFRIIARLFPNIKDLFIYIYDYDHPVKGQRKRATKPFPACPLLLNLHIFCYVPKRYIRCIHGEKDIFPYL